MTLVVEDGTGLSTAESYISVADADTYHSNRGNTAWAALNTASKEHNLRKATDYMEQVYHERWKGVLLKTTQALSWPREWVEREDYWATGSTPPDSVDGTFFYPSDEIPVQVKNACAELALKSISETLAPDLDRMTKREKLGPMEVEYSDQSLPYKKFRSVDNMLTRFLKSGGGTFRKLERV